ncbi:hypothetical protein K504DRAFT_467460 [Pleomassaria siparia CBS 279.74]|uniref:Uncharacterized protein n=1 Tax=Pleomassaria siparia CBS 279.74 TaxID=1314801 RepID=A0A6G1KA38_9PLEO|nr:hypothetical protein K504DRAFT_467460 [Pleomassaria siparia CBS 279.74]
MQLTLVCALPPHSSLAAADIYLPPNILSYAAHRDSIQTWEALTRKRISGGSHEVLGSPVWSTIGDAFHLGLWSPKESKNITQRD